MFRVIAAAIGLSASLAGPVASQDALVNDPTVREGFYAIGLADEVRRNCTSISPRLVRAYSYLKSLERYAQDAGFSDDEIDRLVNDDAAKEQLRGEIRDDLADRGATPGNEAGYCEVGRQEIARNTQAGRLLQGN